MNITHLSDKDFMERIMKPKDDRQELWDLAIEVTKRTPYSAGLHSIPGGVRVLVLNFSGQPVIDSNCMLPQDGDDEFTQSGKRKFIRTIMDDMRKLIRDEPGNAA